MPLSSDKLLNSDGFHVVFPGLLLRSSRQVYKKASQSRRFTETSFGISRDICTGSTGTCQGKKEPGKWADDPHSIFHYRFSYIFCPVSSFSIWFSIKAKSRMKFLTGLKFVFKKRREKIAINHYWVLESYCK